MLNKLKRSVQESPVVDMGGYHYFIHPLTDGLPEVDPTLVEEAIDTIIDKADLDCDYILTAQSMGFPLATCLSMKTGIPYKFIRKRKYGLEGEISIRQSTGYSDCDLYLNYIQKGDRIFLIDDVLSTGGTLRAIITALQKIGVDLSDIVVIFEKIGVREELERELGIQIKSLLRLKMDGKDIEIIGEGI